MQPRVQPGVFKSAAPGVFHGTLGGLKVHPPGGFRVQPGVQPGVFKGAAPGVLHGTAWGV